MVHANDNLKQNQLSEHKNSFTSPEHELNYNKASASLETGKERSKFQTSMLLWGLKDEVPNPFAISQKQWPQYADNGEIMNDWVNCDINGDGVIKWPKERVCQIKAENQQLDAKKEQLDAKKEQLDAKKEKLDSDIQQLNNDIQQLNQSNTKLTDEIKQKIADINRRKQELNRK